MPEKEARQLDAEHNLDLGLAEHRVLFVPERTREVARAAQSEASQMLSQIMAVLLDPNVPEARLDRLLALQKELVADQRRMLFVEAKAAMTPFLPTIERSGKIIVYSKEVRTKAEAAGGKLPEGARPMQETSYAKREDIIEIIRPIIGQYGFDLDFVPGKNQHGRITMKARLSHVGGHVQEIDVPDVEIDSSGSKNNIQGLGSSLTYLQRYGTILLLNIVSRDPRDGLVDNDGADGAHIKGPETISEEQYKKLATEIESQGGGTLAVVLKVFGIPSLSDLPAARYDECVMRLAERRKAAKAAR
jgi:ERF superfamily